MVPFLDGKNKERVALVDPVGRQPIEELAERLVIIFQLLNIVRFTRTTGRMDFAAIPCWSCASEM